MNRKVSFDPSPPPPRSHNASQAQVHAANIPMADARAGKLVRHKSQSDLSAPRPKDNNRQGEKENRHQSHGFFSGLFGGGAGGGAESGERRKAQFSQESGYASDGAAFGAVGGHGRAKSVDRTKARAAPEPAKTWGELHLGPTAAVAEREREKEKEKRGRRLSKRRVDV
jgi:hypothetical protein